MRTGRMKERSGSAEGLGSCLKFLSLVTDKIGSDSQERVQDHRESCC